MKKITFFKTFLVAAGLLAGSSAMATDKYEILYGVPTYADDQTTIIGVEAQTDFTGDEHERIVENQTDANGTNCNNAMPIDGSTLNYRGPWTKDFATPVTEGKVYFAGNYNALGGQKQLIQIVDSKGNVIYASMTDTSGGKNTTLAVATICGTDINWYVRLPRTCHYGVKSLCIDLDARTVTYELIVSSGNNSYDIATGSVALPSDVVDVKGLSMQSVGYDASLDAVKFYSVVSEETKYSYTINYKNGDDIVLTTTGKVSAGTIVKSENMITGTDGKTYLLNVGENGKTTLEVTANEDSNVLDVPVRESQQWSYTVTSSYNGNELAWSVSGTVWEHANTATIRYPRFLAYGKTLVGRAPVGDNLATTITVTKDNYTTSLEYQSEGINNLYLLSEAEDLDTELSIGKPSYSDRVSNTQIIYGEKGALLSLPAGKYIFTLGVIGTPNNGQVDYTVSAGEKQIITGTCDANKLKLLTSEEFTLAEETSITFECTSKNSTNDRGIDLIYVQKTGDVKALTAEYGTYYSDNALDFSETGLTAYIATACDGETVTLKEVTSVPANTGVLLKGDADTYTIPAATETDDVTGNLFEGVSVATEVSAPIYVLYNGEKGVGFYKTSATFTVGANTAYLPVDGNASKLRFVVEGEATAISDIATEKAENGATYNVAGQLVDDNYKGIVIKNGKKYLNK